MGVSKLALVAAAALGLVIPATQAQDDAELAVETAQARGVPKPWKNVRGIGRVLDLTKLPLVIDEPGLYAIDRNWQIPRSSTAANPELIRITAERVTLDLHGFRISADINAPPLSTLLVITGNSAEIRNGALDACCDGAVTVHSTGAGTKLHHLSTFSHETMMFEGRLASITDSQISPRVGIRFTGRSILERNTLSCNRGTCITLLGDGNRIADNELSLSQGPGIAIVGDGNVVANNVIDGSDAVDVSEVFEVDGDRNVVRNNTVLVAELVFTVVRVSGTANTLDGNIAAELQFGRAPAGMVFTGVGNFFGDNRMAAQMPFVGGAAQTDWGGNVGY